MKACLYTTNCTVFTVSMCEVSVRACAKFQIRSSTLAVKLCSRSVASSTLAAKLRVLPQRSLESTLTRRRCFAATIVEASTHPSGSKLRYTRNFSFSTATAFRYNRSTVLASLTACRCVLLTALGATIGGLSQTILRWLNLLH